MGATWYQDPLLSGGNLPFCHHFHSLFNMLCSLQSRHTQVFIFLWASLVLLCLKSLFVLSSLIETAIPHFLSGEIFYEIYLKCYILYKISSRDVVDFLISTLGLCTIHLAYKYIEWWSFICKFPQQNSFKFREGGILFISKYLLVADNTYSMCVCWKEKKSVWFRGTYFYLMKSPRRKYLWLIHRSAIQVCSSVREKHVLSIRDTHSLGSLARILAYLYHLQCAFY